MAQRPALIASCTSPGDVSAAVRPFTPAEVYVNDLDADERQARVWEAYGADDTRLAALRRAWDPRNGLAPTTTTSRRSRLLADMLASDPD